MSKPRPDASQRGTICSDDVHTMPEQIRPGFTLRLALENSSSTSRKSVSSKVRRMMGLTLEGRHLRELVLEPAEDEHEEGEARAAADDDGVAGALGQVRVKLAVRHRSRSARCGRAPLARARGLYTPARACYLRARWGKTCAGGWALRRPAWDSAHSAGCGDTITR